MNKSLDILVSVCVITYNQEPYIRECLNGILAQKTNFRYELLIHDDASTDNTANIIREYENRYPDIIRPIYQSTNQYSNGVRGIFSKFNYPRSKGKYIALCEGDDYWTDPLKLQKQFDLMETYDDISMCFHDALVINSNGVEVVECETRYKKDQYAYFKDLILEGGWFCPTASIFFRSKYIGNNYPDFCRNCHVGDYPLQLYLGSQGKVYYFADKMSVYRYNIPGSWTYRNRDNKINDININNWISEFDMLDGIDRITKYKYHKIILLRKKDFLYINILFLNRTQSKFIIKGLNSVILNFPIIDKIKIFIIKYFPFNNHILFKIYFQFHRTFKL